MSSNFLSRRSFLKAAAATAGATIGTRLVGRGSFEREARAEAEKPALFMVFLKGGYNALFSSAGGLTGKFGITDANVEDLGNGVVVDAGTMGTLPDVAKKKMATIGVVHGLTSHDDNQQEKWFIKDDKSYPLQLAAALGGDGPIKAAIVGGERIPGTHNSEQGVSLQTVRDMDAVLAALGITPATPEAAARAITAAAMDRCAAMSKNAFDMNAKSLVGLSEAYPTGKAVLEKAPMKYDFAGLSNAYDLDGSTAVDNFAAQVAAAELMISAGTNVVVAAHYDDVWDSHGAPSGEGEREVMGSTILPPLKTFLSRMLNDPNRNVAVAILGDFARSLPDSDHQPNCAVSVMGKYVKPGNTGRVNQKANMPSGTPDVPQMWAYLASVLKAPTSPFGSNPHALVK